MIDIWFLREGFFENQESGLIPEDEIFWPESIVYDPFYQMHFPYDLSRKIFEKYKRGELYRGVDWC
jgi:hypothetical protein